MSSNGPKEEEVLGDTRPLVDPSGDTLVAEEGSASEDGLTDSGDQPDLKAKILARLALANAKETREDPLIGTEIGGRFQILARVGEGGMGIVYKARQKNMDRDVAIKVLLAEMAANKTVEKRFYLEALAVSKLRHPNTIQIHDFGETKDGQLYIAMEFLDGRDLKEVIRAEKALAPKRAANVAVQMLRSLREAHSKGIVHRDLKPDNVFLCSVGDEPDFVKVLDFGVAKLRESDKNQATLTKTGAIFGTPRYMSPEQSVSSNVDHRSDLYAIGVMLYEMLAGRTPFEAEMPLSLLIMHVQDPVPFFRDVRPNLVIPPSMEVYVRKLLSKDPDDRYQTAEAAIRALEEIEAGLEDIYRDVVTSEYAEQIGLEIASPVLTMSNTQLTPSHPQLQATVLPAEHGAETDVAIVKRRVRFAYATAAVVLLGMGILVTYNSLEKLPAEISHQGTLSPLKAKSLNAWVSQAGAPLELSKVDSISIRVDSEPSGATVFAGDRPLGKTPYAIEKLRESDRSVSWRVKLDGYKPSDLTFLASADVTRTIGLEKLEGVEAPREKPGKKDKQPRRKPGDGTKPKELTKAVDPPPEKPEVPEVKLEVKTKIRKPIDPFKKVLDIKTGPPGGF